jgi:uncharacterized protein (DUF305 family)
MKMSGDTGSYGRLGAMVGLSFVAMFVLMYSMVDRAENVFPNINQVYMAGLMTAPMVLIELGLMRMMYSDKKTNVIIIGVSILVMVGCYFGVRQQVGVGDKQFLQSMIPHHASALLMCEKAHLQDPEIQKFCNDIISGQQAEIDWMKSKLSQLKD